MVKGFVLTKKIKKIYALHPQAFFKDSWLVDFEFLKIRENPHTHSAEKKSSKGLIALEVQTKPTFAVSLAQTPPSLVSGTSFQKKLIFSISVVSLLNVFSLPKKNKTLPLGPAQLGLIFRRVLLSSGVKSLAFFINGVTSAFSIFFKKLNSPLNRVFWNSFSSSFIFDLGLDLQTKPTEAFILAKLKTPLSQFSDFQQVGLFSNIRKWLALFNQHKASRRGFFWWSQKFLWAQVIFKNPQAHSFYKRKKARSIRRRTYKKLVNKALTRFWL